jgi:hypothetical protein
VTEAFPAIGSFSAVEIVNCSGNLQAENGFLRSVSEVKILTWFRHKDKNYFFSLFPTTPDPQSFSFSLTDEAT